MLHSQFQCETASKKKLWEKPRALSGKTHRSHLQTTLEWNENVGAVGGLAVSDVRHWGERWSLRLQSREVRRKYAAMTTWLKSSKATG